jgi:hypothetical protein
MKPLKEALISKDKRKWASVKDDEIYCVGVYDDDLRLDHAKELTKVTTKDWIEVYVGLKSDFLKYSKALDDMAVDIEKVKDKKLSIKDVIKYLENHDWCGNPILELCKSINEALISKDKRDWATTEIDLYLVDAYNEYFTTIEKIFKNKEIPSKGSRLFILTSKDIRKVLKDTNHVTSMDIRDLLIVYPLTRFKDHDLKLFKDDIHDTAYFENIVASYGLKAIDPTKIK